MNLKEQFSAFIFSDSQPSTLMVKALLETLGYAKACLKFLDEEGAHTDFERINDALAAAEAAIGRGTYFDSLPASDVEATVMLIDYKAQFEQLRNRTGV